MIDEKDIARAAEFRYQLCKEDEAAKLLIEAFEDVLERLRVGWPAFVLTTHGAANDAMPVSLYMQEMMGVKNAIRMLEDYLDALVNGVIAKQLPKHKDWFNSQK